MKKQNGFTLIELVVSIGIAGLVFAGIAKLIDRYTEDTKNSLTAQHLVTVGNAAQAYIKENYTTVMGNATATNPALITVPMLISGGYLQSGFTANNNYGQDVCVLVLEPTPDNLNALVIAEGGTGIDDLSLGDIATQIGSAGGGVYSAAATTIRGAMGGWSTPLGAFANTNNLNQKCGGGTGTPAIAAGHPVMALWFANGDSTSGFLYRDQVPGRPELNTMNTPIIMAAVVTEKSACSTQGAIARNSDGVVVSCQSGLWQRQEASFWRNPVATFAALPTSDEIGTVRMTLDTGRAFVKTGGGGWQALAVDQNGNFIVPGKATINQLDGNLEIVSKGIEFASCSPNGRIATEADGSLLSCQNGTWNRQKSRWAMVEGEPCPSKNYGPIPSGTYVCTGSSPVWPALPPVGPNGFPAILPPWANFLCAGGQWVNMGSCSPHSEGTG